MRADTVDEAIALANAVAFGLTGGIHSLDKRDIEHWKARIQVGNAYVNRSITGAIVQRQPFGGWKGSNIGPGAKAGGPNYVLQLGTWRQVGLPTRQVTPSPAVATALAYCCRCIGVQRDQELLQVSARSYAWAWQGHYNQEHDPSQILGEVNCFRYQPVRSVLLRARTDTEAVAVAQVVLAAMTCAVPLTVSLSPDKLDRHWLAELDTVQVIVEDESDLTTRLAASDALYDRLRVLGPLSPALRQAANAAGINVIDTAVVANGRLELRYYLREQSVSQTVHRYGTILKVS
jgi:RHH-type proline utilization regulon transcriptional repressor/proline dehydrogenase/delta 1-pyrroline-5-carboxylate dehydrogenase